VKRCNPTLAALWLCAACGAAEVAAPTARIDDDPPPVQAAIARLRAAALAPDPALGPFAWLTGTWATRDSGPLTLEHWQPARGGVMLGSGQAIGDGRTLSAEAQRIVAGPPIALVAWPDGAAQPTTFVLAAVGPQEVAFANPGHDFPQRIHYRRTGSALAVTLTGVANGETRTIGYTMRCIDGACRGPHLCSDR